MAITMAVLLPEVLIFLATWFSGKDIQGKPFPFQLAKVKHNLFNTKQTRLQFPGASRLYSFQNNALKTLNQLMRFA